MRHDHDIVIVGGGLVGASLAIALERAGLRAALVEAAPAQANHQPSYDERHLALARATVNALEALGVWAEVGARATPITRIHVSRRGEFGALRLDAAAHGVDAFGAVLPARELGNGLLARLADCRALARYAPAKLTALAPAGDALEARLTTADGERTLRTRLLVGADGTDSFVRAALGIGAETFDYAQTAFVATLTPARWDGCAYERFTAEGPLAVLPLAARRVGVVLTVPAAQAAEVAALDDDGFIARVQERFGWRLGALARPGRRAAYPLRRVRARRLVAPRAVLIGNAAQTLHPVAAQGFNLGLRDALTLAELLVDAAARGDDPGDADLLAAYAERRRVDHAETAALSDTLARVTVGESAPRKWLRSLGLLALDRVAPLKDRLVRHGMGFRGEVPRLALGVPVRERGGGSA
jgi:2-octaprenyl-6-methoxyphenol hydroxylase